MPELKPAYLVHGDDHGAVAERRARLRALAEGGRGGAAAVELLEGDSATPAGLAAALAVMTLAIGGPEPGAGPDRVIIVDGVERWREADVASALLAAMGDMPPATTVALFAREDTRAKAPAAVHEAVRRAGGQVVAQHAVKRWELPRWAREQAARLGLSLDAAAARALVAQVGERQQRLLRELEKLALELAPASDASPVQVGAEDIDRLAARSAEQQAYGLADALVAGDREAAVRSYLRLREQGERLAGLTYLIARRLREALEVAQRLRAGESQAEVKRGLRMPSRAAERFLATVAETEPERLRAALATLADLELDTRGGAPLRAGRGPLAGLGEETLALRAIESVAG